MLRLLLDEHLSPALAAALTASRPKLTAIALRDWHDGELLSAADATILEAARAEGFTLVTLDLRTVPPLLKAWAEQGRRHGGVVFVHRRTLAPGDVGGMCRGLAKLWDTLGDAEWADRVVFLQP